MQFMYLRRKGKKNNPGRHPIGMIGVQKLDDGTVSIGVLGLHSKDRFDKFKGKQMLFCKVYKDRSALLTKPGDLPSLVDLVGANVARLDNKTRHQEILEKLVLDEFTGGPWSKQK